MSSEERSLRPASHLVPLEPGRDIGVWCLTRDGEARPATPSVRNVLAYFRYDGASLHLSLDRDAIEPTSATSQVVSRVAAVEAPAGEPPAVEPAGRLFDEDPTVVRPPLAAEVSDEDFVTEAVPRKPCLSVPPPLRPRIVPRRDSRVEGPSSTLPDLAPASDSTIATVVRVAPPAPDSRPAPARSAPPPKRESSSPVAAARPAPSPAPRDFGDDETRVGPPPVVPSKPIPTMKLPALRPEVTLMTPTVVTRTRKPRLSPVRVGIAATLVLLVGMSFTAPSRRAIGALFHPQKPVKTAAVAPAAHPAAAPVAAPAPTAPTAPVASAPVAPVAASAPVRGPVDERSAVLAVESGATDRAAALYGALAAAHPDNAAYREAARILAAKVAP